jgi:hypothetical protein
MPWCGPLSSPAVSTALFRRPHKVFTSGLVERASSRAARYSGSFSMGIRAQSSQSRKESYDLRESRDTGTIGNQRGAMVEATRSGDFPIKGRRTIAATTSSPVGCATRQTKGERQSMKRSIAIAAMLTIALAGCGSSSADEQASASPSASAAPLATATPDPANTLSIKLGTANIVGTPEPDGTIPVRVTYRATVNAPNGIQAAFGRAELPFGTSCNGDGTIPIELGSLPAGANVERPVIVLCSSRDAKQLTDEPPSPNFFGMTFTPSRVIQQ